MEQLNKVVVAYLDGRRLKGYAYDFSALKDSFNLLPQEDPLQGRGTKIEMKDLKAVFFVKDFIGNRGAYRSQVVEPNVHGRRIEVTFADGEKFVGTTEGYNPQRVGFFMFPADPKTNTVRTFVVTKNARQVRFI